MSITVSINRGIIMTLLSLNRGIMLTGIDIHSGFDKIEAEDKN